MLAFFQNRFERRWFPFQQSAQLHHVLERERLKQQPAILFEKSYRSARADSQVHSQLRRNHHLPPRADFRNFRFHAISSSAHPLKKPSTFEVVCPFWRRWTSS